MRYSNILITGGAGFVGSNLCIFLAKNFPTTNILAFDNLYRKGSELSIHRFEEYKNITFVKGDVRDRNFLLSIHPIDLVIECSAEPSVMAGVTSTPEYLLDTNLIGAINCLELCRKEKADIIFLSTSRVYPVEAVNAISFVEDQTRFSFADKDFKGIHEQFSLNGPRTLYGTTKLSAEMLLEEYRDVYGIGGIVNRFGVIAGPWQMGKIDQGFIALWVASHVFDKPLSYIGFGGLGKQVRDVIHIQDACELIMQEIDHLKDWNGMVANVGGGMKYSTSLLELTTCCEQVTKKHIEIDTDPETRKGDVRIYITDNSHITEQTGWNPTRSIEQTVQDTYVWIKDNVSLLTPIFSS